MDTALQLRLAWENKEKLSDEKIKQLLNESQLLKKLTTTEEDRYLSAIFKLVGLSEIPFAETLEYTQNLIIYINKHLATENGFSYTGKSDDIVPCYNAMLLEAYTRLGLKDSQEAQNALNWIKKYQLFDRNLTTTWKGKGICRHGGCLKSTPCYIGIGKTIRALITYNEYTDGTDEEVKRLIIEGTEYMLKHQFFLRLSEEKPISRNITYSAFPQSYFLTLTDLVYIIGKCQLTTHPQTEKIMKLIQEKSLTENTWKIEYIYTYKGYASFETRRGQSEWLSNLYPLWLNQK